MSRLWVVAAVAFLLGCAPLRRFHDAVAPDCPAARIRTTLGGQVVEEYPCRRTP